MVEEKEKDKIIEELREELAQSKKTKTPKRSGGFGDFISKAQFYANVPRDPFAHQYMMIHKPTRDIKHPSDLLSPDILLSNVKDDRTMLLFQRDFYYLHRFFAMGLRSAAVMTLFTSLYYPWEGQMRMTATKSGGERSYQSFVEPDVETRGFGLDFLRKKQKTKKKQGIMDYMHPQEQENIYE